MSRSVEQVIKDHKASGKFITVVTVVGVQTFLLDWGEGKPVFAPTECQFLTFIEKY